MKFYSIYMPPILSSAHLKDCTHTTDAHTQHTHTLMRIINIHTRQMPMLNIHIHIHSPSSYMFSVRYPGNSPPILSISMVMLSRVFPSLAFISNTNEDPGMM